MCKPVHHEVDFRAKPREVYEAYLDSRRQTRITGATARMSRKVGGRFTAGDGYIRGFNLDLVPGKRIVQAWRGSDWEDGAYSILTLEMRPRGKGTRMVVDHLGIPDDQRAGVDQGWHDYYWTPMKTYFEERPE
jgi:activator of HSP90 ATPase